MNKKYGSFEETIEAVQALSEHRRKRGVMTNYKGAKWMSDHKPMRKVDGEVNLELAIHRGWCSRPIVTPPLTASSIQQMRRQYGIIQEPQNN